MKKSPFGAWLDRLNAEVDKWGGPAPYDMPPLGYDDLFDSGYSPKEVSEMVRKYEEKKGRL